MYIKLLLFTLLANFCTGLSLCLAVGVFTQVPNYTIACVVGLLCSAGSVLCFFASWRSAPKGFKVALFYMLRLFLIFGSVIIFVFLPFNNALGAILPHLPTMPITALFMALNKK